MTTRKIIKTTALSLLVLAALVFAGIYAWSSIILNKSYPVPLTEVQVPHDSASIAEGARLLKIAHCGDCHSQNLTGRIFPDVPPNLATLVAPNITRIIPTYSDAQIVRLLRYGVKKDGHSVYIMPAFMYHELKEESIVKMIACLRSLSPRPNSPNLPPKSSFTLLGRLLIIRGEVPQIAGMIKPNTEGKYVHCDSTRLSFGRYMALSTCTSCHGQDLKGLPGLGPNLIIAASYKKEDFFKLIRTGVALGDRKVGLMSQVTSNYLCYLNDREIESIYTYLQTKPTQSIAKK